MITPNYVLGLTVSPLPWLGSNERASTTPCTVCRLPFAPDANKARGRGHKSGTTREVKVSSPIDTLTSTGETQVAISESNISSAYKPPQDFAEFLQRYPNLIETRVARWCSYRPLADREDLVQDVYAYLMDLPATSDHRRRGCRNRIATFDPRLLPECSERLFLGYILRITDYCLSTLARKARNRVLEHSDSLEGLGDKIGATTEDAIAIFVENTRMEDPVAGLQFEDFCNVAFSIHPILAYAAAGLTAFETKAEVCAWMGVSEDRLRHIMRHLRYIAQGDLAKERFRSRRAYRPRRKVETGHAS